MPAAHGVWLAKHGGARAVSTSYGPRRLPGPRAPGGFTLLEVLLAIAILAVVTMVTMLTFSTVTKAWRRGLALTDRLHHGDFVVEQLCMGLRSCYYRASGTNDGSYGFWLTDGGEGEEARDVISWVKLGSALVGKHQRYASTPHRVVFGMEADEDGEDRLSSRAWRMYGQSEEFDPDEIEPEVLSRRIVGFDCRTAYEEVDDEPDWLDEWEHTNKIPKLVEVSLYVESLAPGEDPVEIKRVVSLPVGPRAWK